MKLFDYFDKVYCINLKHRSDRLTSFDEQVKKHDLGSYSRFDAIDGTTLDLSKYNTNLKPGEVGVILSNLSILEDAKKNNYKKILILEDDCYFTDEITNFYSNLKFLPNDWDMFYMGGNHNTHMGLPGPLVINEKVVKLHSTYSAHFIAIKCEMFDFLKVILEKLKEPLDVSYARIQKSFNVYSFYPAAAKQKSDFSNIQNQIMDYNWLIK